MVRIVLIGLALLAWESGRAQLTQQKETVGFLFGTLHPRDERGNPLMDAAGKPVALDAALGTAFFVAYPDQRGGPNFVFSYLVTAKHVLKDADGRFLSTVRLRLNLQQPEDNREYEFIDDIPVADQAGKLLWLHNASDNAVDVAIRPLLPDLKRFNCKAVGLGMFIDEKSLKSESVAEGDPLFFIGLMNQYYGISKNHPVVRQGTLAIMTDERVDTPTGPQNVFIAELASWPGNSGSPVFLNLGGLRSRQITMGSRLKFFGLLAGGFLNRSKAPMVEKATVVWGKGEPTGVSFIIPARQIRAVLESPAVQALRDAEIQRRKLP
jgi:hypothetical protein